jgi:hypothetical protein
MVDSATSLFLSIQSLILVPGEPCEQFLNPWWATGPPHRMVLHEVQALTFEINLLIYDTQSQNPDANMTRY